MFGRARPVAFLLFGSGFCALIYQTTWLREFRLIFGTSTAATAVVLGVFMAGLGFGGIVLGKRSENVPDPLRFYANLELLIAGTAACSPILIWLVRHLYIAVGGTGTLGIFFGTIVRLLFAVVILGAPTFLMGGTLSAAGRAVVRAEDLTRRSIGLIYGANTLGAVAGAFAATFYFLEQFGNRMTLWLAAVANVLIALAAFKLSVTTRDREIGAKISPNSGKSSAAITSNSRFVLVAAAVVGFAFFLMELVWYRMLGPLLGGSTFSFGLILASALLGIGCGGVAYSFQSTQSSSLKFFAMTCAAEAFFIALPYALGDRIALLAMLVRPLGTFGFYGYVLAWAAVCGIVVFPAAFIAGIQFPALIALLGKGRRQVGSQTGAAYAWNTLGAVAGSLAGGFGLIPVLSAPRAWVIVVILLAALSVLAALVASKSQSGHWQSTVCPILTSSFAIAMVFATGPTAFWRHSEIGVGRLAQLQGSPNEMQDLMQAIRRRTIWETDGIESSVALTSSGFAFIVNGRTDGSAKSDAGTQIMIGLIGAALHPHPAKALVIGLGTGSTAGWLGAVSEVERVDVVELEPAIARVAERCSPVNQNALHNPKVHLTIGDAREFLVTSNEKYDIVVSEPSNPYRAGIASLFTGEYYQSVDHCLRPGGIFLQWMPAYEIDDRTIEIAYRTLGSVFADIESWQTASGDLLLVGSHSPNHYDVAQLRLRLASEPFKSAMAVAWRSTSVEEFLGHFVGNQRFSDAMQHLTPVPTNTDDHTVIEFAFARTASVAGGLQIPSLRVAAHAAHADRPRDVSGTVDWSIVDETRLCTFVALSRVEQAQPFWDVQQRIRASAFVNYSEGNLSAAWHDWRAQSERPKTLSQLAMVAECAASEGDSAAAAYIDQLAEALPRDAEAIRAEYLWRTRRPDEAVDVFRQFFAALREDPWPIRELISRSLIRAQAIATSDKSKIVAGIFNDILREPFCILNNDGERLNARLGIARYLDGEHPGGDTLDAIQAFEPHVPWQRQFLETRKTCYTATHDPRAARATRDLARFMEREVSTADAAAFAQQIQDRSVASETP